MSELNNALNIIFSNVKDAREGLGQKIFHFISKLTPMINVDILAEDNDGRKLLTWRSDKFYGPGWHVPGGVIRFKEKINDRINAVAMEELNAKISFKSSPNLVRENITCVRDTRGHFISLLFCCKIIILMDDSLEWDGINEPLNGQIGRFISPPSNLIPQHEPYKIFF